MDRKILVDVRHGDKSPNGNGQSNPLTPLGFKQAVNVGLKIEVELKELRVNLDSVVVFSSPVQRVLDTANAALPCLGLNPNIVKQDGRLEWGPSGYPDLSQEMIDTVLADQHDVVFQYGHDGLFQNMFGRLCPNESQFKLGRGCAVMYVIEDGEVKSWTMLEPDDNLV